MNVSSLYSPFSHWNETYHGLKVPNCKVFDLLDSLDFDATNPIWEDNVATGIFRHFFMLGADRAEIFSASSPKLYSCCAADAAFRAVQLKVAIPWWLRLYQKEGLYQEEKITARISGRSHVKKEKEAKNYKSLHGGAAR